MQKIKKLIGKFILASLIVLGFNENLFAGYTLVSEIGTTQCTVSGISETSCMNDMECKIKKDFCTIALNTLGGTVESETLKAVITWGGKLIVNLMEIAIEKNIATSGASAHIITEVGKTLGIVGGVDKVGSIKVGSTKDIKGSDLIAFVIETIFEVSVDYLIDSSDLKFARLNNAPVDSYRKAFKLLFRVAKNDLKATYYLWGAPNLEDKLNAFKSGVFDNSLILGEIGVEVYNSGVEALSERDKRIQSEKIGAMLDLYITTRNIYLKENADFSIVINFLNDCKNLNLDKVTENTCLHYYNDLIETKLYRYDLLPFRSKIFSLTQYDMFIKANFPDDEYSSLSKLYDIENLDYEILKNKNNVAYKYLKNALAYGFELKDFTLSKVLFNETQNITEQKAFEILNDGYLFLDKSNQTLLLDYNYSNINFMTRRKFAILLNEVFNLESKLSQTKINALKIKGKILDGSVGWFYDALVLKELDIVHGQGIGVANQFRPDDNLTMYEMLVMLMNTMNYKKCGHVQCNISYILEIQ